MEDFDEIPEAAEEVRLEVPENGIPLTGDSGVVKVVLQKGKSLKKPTKGSKVTVDYTGKLTDGTVFDSSLKHGSKFSFGLGKGEVIKAWDLGVASMEKGEKCELHCAPKYGYGARGSPPKIPPNAVLIFEIELHSWEAEDLTDDLDKGVTRELIEEGLDYSMPNDGATVDVSLIGKHKDRVFDERQITYEVCEAGDELHLVPAIDITLKKMKRKGHCQIHVMPKYGFGSTGSKHFGIPADAELDYEITLHKFESAKEAWELLDEERVEHSGIVKEKGTKFLKEGKVRKAVIQYKKILDYLEHLDAKEDGSEKDQEIVRKSKELQLAGSLNLALCYMKLKDYAQAISKCEEALKLDMNNEKALYRIGDAYYNQKMYEDAKKNFEKTLKVNPKNKLARQMSEKCAAEIKRQHEVERSKFKGMFDKFSREDEEAEIRRKVEQQKEKAKAKAAKKEEGGEPNGVASPAQAP